MTTTPAPAGPRARRAVIGVVVLVFLVGAAVRLHMLFSPSPLFYGTYDDGVHFSAALNLVHGNLLYRDVVFLQPPGVVLAASPFALLAEWIGDGRAFALGRIAFALIGALNGALVAVILRRWGIGAMLVGGLLYALSYAAAYDERTITLEVIGTTGLVASLVLIDLASRRPARRWVVLAGLAAGVSIDFKIWYIVPFVVIAVLAGRRIGWFVLGGAVAGLAGYLPFFLAAPQRMWAQVVAAQLGRPKSQSTPIGVRLRSMLGVGTDGGPGVWQLWGRDVVIGLTILVLLLAVVALTARGARRFVVLLAVNAGVLLLSPSYFQHYAVLTSAPIALVAGVAVVRLGGFAGRHARPITAIAVAAALLVALVVDLRQATERSNQQVAPIAALRAASAKIPGCMVSDDPTILILMNRLTPDLEAGCQVRSDPSGYGYTIPGPDGKQVSRSKNPLWQRSALEYLRSADSYILVRGKAFGLSAESRAVVDADRVLYERGAFVIRTAR